MSNLKVIHCLVGRLPVWVEVVAGESGSTLEAEQRLVAGPIACLSLYKTSAPAGLTLWYNDVGVMIGAPLNRVIPVAPLGVRGVEDADFVIRSPGLAGPNDPGEWRIHGDFFLARDDDNGNLAPCTDEDFTWAMSTFEREDIEAAKEMNRIRAEWEPGRW